MDYQGYFSKEELINLIDESFPYIAKPTNDEIFSGDKNDLMRKIIEPRLDAYTKPDLPLEGVLLLHDESASITNKAVQWFLPSLLRIVLKNKDLSETLHWDIPSYLDCDGVIAPSSSFDFSWLNARQVFTLHIVLEYLGEEYGLKVAHAQNNLEQYVQKT